MDARNIKGAAGALLALSFKRRKGDKIKGRDRTEGEVGIPTSHSSNKTAV